MSDEEVADMIRVADEDGDGRINFNEFKTIMEFVVSIHPLVSSHKFIINLFIFFFVLFPLENW